MYVPRLEIEFTNIPIIPEKLHDGFFPVNPIIQIIEDNSNKIRFVVVDNGINYTWIKNNKFGTLKLNEHITEFYTNEQDITESFSVLVYYSTATNSIGFREGLLSEHPIEPVLFHDEIKISSFVVPPIFDKIKIH